MSRLADIAAKVRRGSHVGAIDVVYLLRMIEQRDELIAELSSHDRASPTTRRRLVGRRLGR